MHCSNSYSVFESLAIAISKYWTCSVSMKKYFDWIWTLSHTQLTACIYTSVRTDVHMQNSWAEFFPQQETIQILKTTVQMISIHSKTGFSFPKQERHVESFVLVYQLLDTYMEDAWVEMDVFLYVLKGLDNLTANYFGGLEKTARNIWENFTLVRRSDCNHLCCKFFIKVSCVCFRCNLWLKRRYKLQKK